VRGSAADREFTVGVFDEPFRAGDNHRADRIRALDMAVVVNLDPVQRSVDAERRRNSVEQLTLRGTLCKAATKRLARGWRGCGLSAAFFHRAAARRV